MINKSDNDLVAFFTKADSDTVSTVIEMMDTFWQTDLDEINKHMAAEGMPGAGTSERKALAETLVHILRYFGSHNMAYAARSIFADEPGVHYHEILQDVAKSLRKQVKHKEELPTVASVSDWERIVCENLLKIQFQDKTEEEIAQMLEESGLDREAVKQAAKGLTALGIGGGGLVALVRILEKKTVQEIIRHCPNITYTTN